MYSLFAALAAILILCSYVGLVRTDTTIRTYTLIEIVLISIAFVAATMTVLLLHGDYS